MSKKWDAIRGSAEFYITMAVCLVVIGVSGYFLLFGGVSPEERLEEEAPSEEAIVTDPAPEVEVSAEEPVVEAIAPETVETPAVMPEVEIDDTPVVAEIPRQLVDPLEGEVVTAFSMEELVSRVEEQSPRTVEAYRARLTQKMEEVLGQAGIDEQRILAEAAIFADHIAVDEETVRLRSHIQGFREIMDAGQAMGRKLDFLVQEMNREANTIGSKGQDVEVARIVVELKSQIEKIREQIQNIE